MIGVYIGLIVIAGLLYWVLTYQGKILDKLNENKDNYLGATYPVFSRWEIMCTQDNLKAARKELYELSEIENKTEEEARKYYKKQMDCEEHQRLLNRMIETNIAVIKGQEIGDKHDTVEMEVEEMFGDYDARIKELERRLAERKKRVANHQTLL